jgi:hypothetical protein
MKKITTLFLLIFSCLTQADVFNITLMAMFNSQSVYRGAQLWPDPGAMVGPGFLFFDRRLKVFGPSIFYDFFPGRDNSFKLEIGARYFNDNRPWLRFKEREEGYRNQRKDSMETNLKFSYAFGYRKKFEVGAMIAKEVHRFYGNYSEVRLQTPLLPFTTLAGKLSLAEKSYNQYLYGPTSKSGTGYAAMELTFVFPFVPWKGVIINSLEQSWVTQTINRNADYVRGNGDHLKFTTRWMWNAF